MFGKTSLALVCGLFNLLVIDTCNYGRPVEQGRPLHFCPVVSSSVFCLSFFPRLISAVADWISAILPHMVWP